MPAGLTSTQLGSGILDGLSHMEKGALAVERRLASRDTGLEGSIVVMRFDWLGDYLIAPIAARFGALHRLVNIELVNDTRAYNLSRREADIAFRFGSFDQEDLVLRKVAGVTYGLYASNDYVEQYGLPDFEEGCKGHVVAYLYDTASHVSHNSWLRKLTPNAQIGLRSNGLSAHLPVVENGISIAVLPRIIGDQRLNLRHIVAPLPEPQQSIQLGVHSDMRDAPCVRAFIDFAVLEFKTLLSALNSSEAVSDS